MKRQPVTSSVLASIGYDPKARILEVEFTSGRIYQYAEVPSRILKALRAAESAGSFFNENIRDDFPYVQIR
jgi:hypothetical protein